jgi:hypothetical protein
MKGIGSQTLVSRMPTDILTTAIDLENHKYPWLKAEGGLLFRCSIGTVEELL